MTDRRSSRRRHLLALEPRMMFDAAAVATTAALPGAAEAGHAPQPFADAHVGDAPHAVEAPGRGHAMTPVTRDHVHDPGRDASPATMAIDDARTPATGDAKPHDIIFIDTSVEDYQQLAAEWADKGEIVLIDGTKDGLAQVQAALAGEHDVSAIHIVSHGEEGAFFLGTTRVDEASIKGALAGELAQIGSALAPGGDILIYGCDFAEGADGASALTALANATHADVAASTDLTGYAGAGGDWTLEAHRGQIQAESLYSADWVHTLDPNNPIPISASANSLTVVYNGQTVVTGTTGYGSDARSPDVGQGAVATWANVATYQGHNVDLRATVVSLTSGDAIRFNQPVGPNGRDGDDPTFLLRDLTSGNTPAQVVLRWELVDHDTGAALAADVRFTISDIDGIGGQPGTRESVQASTDNLTYYEHEKVSDIVFDSNLQRIIASGTEDENTDASKPISSASNATFDWSKVSSFTLTYTLAPNSVTSQAQFYQDGNATFTYNSPVYVSIPRLDLDANDSTALGNDAHFVYTEHSAPISVADTDLSVVNPMPVGSPIVGASIQLINAQAGDNLVVGTLPSDITAQTAVANGTITVTLSGNGSVADYTNAIRAVQFVNTIDNPSSTQRVIDVTFSNDTLTSNVAVSRIDINHVPRQVGTLPNQTANDADAVDYQTSQAFSDPDGDTLTYSASGLPTGLSINAATGEITGTLDHRASQVNGGNYAITVTATDPSNAATTQSFSLAVANPPPTANNDSATTKEDTAVTINVLANDTDPDHDTLTVTGATAQHGSVVVNADNTLTYTPGADYNGADTIHYSISDGDSGTSSANVAVTITPVEDAPRPVGTLPAQTTHDHSTVSYATANGFTDPDGDTLTYSATGLPAGLTINAATGVISGTVDRNASLSNGGVYHVVVTATDPSNESTTQPFTLTVVNDPPTANPDRVTTPEDTAITIDPLANDTDPEGDPLTVTAASAQHGTVTINADNTLRYIPGSNYNGTDTIAYSISDGHGHSSSSTVTVTITPVNDPPSRVGTLPNRTANDADTVDYPTAQAFTDVDGDQLSYSATGLPTGLSINAQTGEITGTIDHRASQVNGGAYSITVTATDPSNASTTQTFSLAVSNPPPTARNDTASTSENVPVTIKVLANDTDPDGDQLFVSSASASNGSVVRNADGTITYTPNTYFHGTDTIAYTIRDGDGGSSSATVTVTVAHVNQAPQPSGSLPNQASQDAATVSYATAQAFSDPDGDALTYSASGLPTGLTIDAGTGVISGRIDHSASQTHGGTYTITVTATDPSHASTAQGFTLTVTNPPPVAVDDPQVSLHSGDSRTIAVLGNDYDPDGDTLTVAAASAAHGTVAINPDGTLTYTAGASYTGSDTISYTISDGQGGTASAHVPIMVGNTAPNADQLPDQTAADGQAINLPLAGDFHDADGDTLTYSASGLPAGLAIDPATGVVSGTIDRSASQSNGGSYVAQITANDGHGGTVTAPLRWTVSNPAPVAQDDSATTAEDTPVTINVLANDRDPDGDPLVVTGASALHGSVTINPDNTLTYTPGANYNGQDTIHYTISDGQGGTAAANVAVTVTPVEDAPRPVGTLPAQSTQDHATVSYATAGGFTDPDGDTLTYAATGLPAGLSIDPATGVISGTVDRSASQSAGGVYHVVVTATDPSNESATQRFDIGVTNPPPVAVDDTASTHAGTPVTIAVLANDSDPDGDPLTVTSAAAHGGQVSINPDGTLAYTPPPGFVGQDTIDYSISDGQGGTASAHVTVTVGNAAPVHGDVPAQQAQDNEPFSSPVGQSFSDPDGDPLTFTAAGLPPGLTIDPATGIVSGTPSRDASRSNGGVYDAIVTATDPYGAQSSAAVHFVVGNTAPVANPDSATTDEGTPVRIAVLANDTDANGDAITLTGASADHGQVAVNPDGTLTYTPAADYTGSDTIRYTIADDHGNPATGTVAVTVQPVSDAPRPVGTEPSHATQDGATVSYPTAQDFTDPDGNTLHYGATGLPAGLSIDPTTGVISGTVDRSASQSNGAVYHVVVTATDPSNASATQAFDITVAVPPPVANDDSATAHAGTPTTIDVLANDSDPDGYPLTVSAAAAHNGSVAINPDGTITYTSVPGFVGTDTIDYSVSDGRGGSAVAHVSVAVTDAAPTHGTVAAQQAQDGEPFSAPIGQSFGDPDGDPLTFTATGLPPGLTIDPATGTISGTPSHDASRTNGGSYDAVVTARDPSGATTSATVHFTIGNSPPVTGSDSASTTENAPVTIDVLANAADPNGDPLTVVSASAAHGQVTVNPDGTLTYTPASAYTGADTISYSVADDHGNTAPGNVAVTVRQADNGPVSGPAPMQSANDGQPVSLDLGSYFSDPDGKPLTYSASGLPPGLAIDPATGQVSGTLPHDASRGSVYHVTITATDPAGASAASSFDWAIANPAPVAVNDTAATPEDRATTIAVLANDRDPDGDALAVTAASAGHGSVAINPDGTLTYTPAASFTGQDVISYTIADSDGATAQATVLVTVTRPDSAPVADAPVQPVTASTDATPFSYAAALSFSDPDGDQLTYSASGLPAGLAIDPATGIISGTIDRNASQIGGGRYDIVVTATDPSGLSATTHVPLAVTDRAPIAADDNARTSANTGVVIPVLGNDHDPDGDPLTVVAASADHGTVTRNADGTITYQPGADFSGSDTIRYTISDGKGGDADAIVSVYVDPANRAPIVPSPGQPIDATAGQPIGIDLVSMIRDPDGDQVTITRATSANGSVTMTPGGVMVFTPSLGFDGLTTVTYTASDGHGGNTTGTLVFRVEGPTADIEQLLRIGRVTFVDPPHPVVTVATDGEVRNPLAILATVDDIRSLNDTVIGRHAVIDAVDDIRSLDGIGDVAAHGPVAAEVARLDALRDLRDAGDRLFDHRWSDFQVHPLAGFSAAADRHAQIMVESVVRGGAIQIEVRDTAPDGCAGFRTVDVRPARGRTAEWLHVDHRGMAIVERAADMDELHLLVIVTRDDGSRSVTPVVIQGATGEIELDRRQPHHRHHHRAAPLNAAFRSTHDHQAAARRLGRAFR